MSGAFITLEGGDGSGKSTQAGMLVAWLEAQGRTVVRTREPGGTALGVEIRRLVQHTEGHVAPRAEALLYAADRAHHIATLVRPALERGEVVVQDRYLDSSVAYQGSGRDLGAVEVHDLQMWAVGSLVPDLTVIVDVPSEVGRRRRGEVHDRLESEGDTFHDTVRQHFLAMAQGSPERYLVVDGTSSTEEIHDAVMGRLTSSGLLEVGSP